MFLRQLRKHLARAAFRGEADRRERLLTELRTARLTGTRVAVPVEALEGRLASLPEGVKVARDWIEVRFSGAQEAVARLYALAQVLSNDYDRFETLVRQGRGVRMSEALMPTVARPEITRPGGAVVLPAVIVDAGIHKTHLDVWEWMHLTRLFKGQRSPILGELLRGGQLGGREFAGQRVENAYASRGVLDR